LRTFREIAEAYKTLPDTKIDYFIKKEWGSAKTYSFDINGSLELSKILDDIIVTKDNKFVHIPGVLSSDIGSKVDKILKKYDMEDVDGPLYQHKLGRF